MDSLRIGFLTTNLNAGNMGCNALSYSALRLFESVSDPLGITFSYFLFGEFSSDIMGLYPKLAKAHIQVVPPRATLRSKMKALLARQPVSIKHFSEIFSSCEILFEIAGGDSFSDMYGIERLQREHCFHRKAQKNRVPLIFAPQTIGPFRSEKAKRIAADSLSYATRVFVRDPLSFEETAKYANRDKISQTIDMAFFMDYEKRERASKRLQVGINPSGLLWNGGYTGGNQFGLQCDYRELLSRLIDLLERRDVEVVLVPHVLRGPTYYGEDDYIVCLWLKQKHPLCTLAPFFYTPTEAKSYISGLDLLIGSRMHCCIAAYSSGVPIYPLAYSRKFRGLFKDELKYPYGAELVDSDADTIVSGLQDVLTGIPAIQAEMPGRLETVASYKKSFLIDLRHVCADAVKGTVN